MLGEHLLAQRVERFGLGADLVLEQFWDVDGEWERVEAAGLTVTWIVAHTEPCARCECPRHVELARQNAHRIGVIQCDAD